MAMRYILDSDFHAHAMDLAMFKKYIGKESQEYKKPVLEYMERRPEPGYTTEKVYDHFSGEYTGKTDNCYNDGIFYWFESDIYNLEKYNVRIRQDFVEWVLEKMRGMTV